MADWLDEDRSAGRRDIVLLPAASGAGAGGPLSEGEMGQTREGSLKCVNCGGTNFYECGCYDRCLCGHDRRLHMATGTCTVVGCECVHGFDDSAGRPPADTVARLTRERDEARAQVARARKLVEKWRDSEYLRDRIRHGYDSLDCADELDAALAVGEAGEKGGF